MKDRAVLPNSPVSMRIINHREVAAAEAGTAQETASCDQRQASLKVARSSTLEAIWDQRTEGGVSCESFCRE